jgi:hypothetical protein
MNHSTNESFDKELISLVQWFQENIQSIQYDNEKKKYELVNMRNLCEGLYSNDLSDSPMNKPFVFSLVTGLERVIHCLQIYKHQEKIEVNNNLLISIQHMRVVYTILELLWHWGLKQQLTALTCFSLPDEVSQPKSLLVNKEMLNFLLITEKSKLIINCTNDLLFNDLLRIVKVIIDVVTEEMFIHQMLERNLSRLLLSLLTLLL